MPGPPPPPPGPPPPPMMAPMKKGNAPMPASSDMRGALLGQIQKGAKLKKVTTVDKSGPLISGRIADGSNPSPSRSRGQPSSNKSSPDTASSSPVSGSKPGQFMNLTDELQFKLTMKKNKSSPTKEPAVSETKENLPSNSFLNEIKSKQSVISPHHTQSHAPSTPDGAVANKSSLFNKSPGGVPPTVLNQPKVINHGKPNLAPKPPQLKMSSNASGNGNDNNNNNNNGLNGDSNRKVVARHQSMKSPRSPPVALAPSGPFNSDNHFGTIRLNQSNVNKMQEALNLSFPSQKSSIAQRPTIKPPPPPVPNRQPGTNLSQQSHAKSTTALNIALNEQLSAPRRLPNSGSSNNISSMERNIDQSDAPPLPPHRMSSQTQLRAPPAPVSSNPAPPEVPRRHSSMRNSSENGGNNRYPSSPNPNQPITRLVVDLEARYSLLFHNVSEFPVPKPFLNLEKSYPSRAVRPANGI